MENTVRELHQAITNHRRLADTFKKLEAAYKHMNRLDLDTDDLLGAGLSQERAESILRSLNEGFAGIREAYIDTNIKTMNAEEHLRELVSGLSK